MAKKKCGLIKEFKDFISRGNVMDLAVGMIIGAAFTAIITAVVNGILKPLINWIPIGDISGLRTVLGDKVYMIDEATGKTVIDWASTNYIDWGSVITAIITFILTAIVLFAIVKVFNTMKKKAEEAKAKAEAAIKKEEEAKEEAPAEAAPAVVEEPKETAEDLLKQIRDELAKLNAKE